MQWVSRGESRGQCHRGFQQLRLSPATSDIPCCAPADKQRPPPQGAVSLSMPAQAAIANSSNPKRLLQCSSLAPVCQESHLFTLSSAQQQPASLLSSPNHPTIAPFRRPTPRPRPPFSRALLSVPSIRLSSPLPPPPPPPPPPFPPPPCASPPIPPPPPPPPPPPACPPGWFSSCVPDAEDTRDGVKLVIKVRGGGRGGCCCENGCGWV